MCVRDRKWVRSSYARHHNHDLHAMSILPDPSGQRAGRLATGGLDTQICIVDTNNFGDGETVRERMCLFLLLLWSVRRVRCLCWFESVGKRYRAHPVVCGLSVSLSLSVCVLADSTAISRVNGCLTTKNRLDSLSISPHSMSPHLFGLCVRAPFVCLFSVHVFCVF